MPKRATFSSSSNCFSWVSVSSSTKTAAIVSRLSWRCASRRRPPATSWLSPRRRIGWISPQVVGRASVKSEIDSARPAMSPRSERDRSESLMSAIGTWWIFVVSSMSEVVRLVLILGDGRCGADRAVSVGVEFFEWDV